MKINYLFSCLLILFVACQSKPQNKSNQERSTQVIEKATPQPLPPKVETPVTQAKDSYRKKTASGKIFTIIQKVISDTEWQYTLTGEGFRATQTLSTRGRGRMKDVFLGDINGDGFEELYIISDKKEALLTAFASYRDKSIGEIAVPAVSKKLLSGYNGKDSFKLIEGKLLRSFPIYKDDQPTGETRTLQYTLEMGEASYLLKASLARK